MSIFPAPGSGGEYFVPDDIKALNEELPEDLRDLSNGGKRRLGLLRERRHASLDDLPERTVRDLKFVRYYEERTDGQDTKPEPVVRSQFEMRFKRKGLRGLFGKFT